MGKGRRGLGGAPACVAVACAKDSQSLSSVFQVLLETPLPHRAQPRCTLPLLLHTSLPVLGLP